MWTRSICKKFRGINDNWDDLWPIWNILGQSTEVLTDITQDMRLEFVNIRKKQIWPNRQDIKAHWYKLYSNKS